MKIAAHFRDQTFTPDREDDYAACVVVERTQSSYDAIYKVARQTADLCERNFARINNTGRPDEELYAEVQAVEDALLRALTALEKASLSGPAKEEQLEYNRRRDACEAVYASLPRNAGGKLESVWRARHYLQTIPTVGTLWDLSWHKTLEDATLAAERVPAWYGKAHVVTDIRPV